MITNKEKIVRKIANKMVIKYSLEPPVNLFKIIEGENILYEENEIQGDGYSVFGNTKIVINSDSLYLPRKRFTIAHELGHCIIPWHDDVTICQIEDNYSAKNRLDIQEKEANVFASELLMPEIWIKKIIHEEEVLGIEHVINSVVKNAKTSFMATMYALEYSLPSGHVFFVHNLLTGYCSYFISRDTLTTVLYSVEKEEKCKLFACNYEIFSVGTAYDIEHYELLECPSKERIRQLYIKNNKNLKDTLLEISENNIFYIYHCIDKVLSYIDDKYALALFDTEKVISIVMTEGCIVSVPYHVTYLELLNLCEDKYDKYEVLNLVDDFKLIMIKEEYFEESANDTSSEYNSNQLLKDILYEIYLKEEAKKMLHSINGIIGSANGQNRGVSREKLYNILKYKFLKKGYEKFIEHPMYEEFLSLRISQILSRKR